MDDQVAVGKPAPDFKLLSQNDAEWRLSDHLGNVVVLLFYPQNETLVCTRQLCSVRDNWDKYLETKAAIVGISPGTAAGHQAFAAKRELPLLLLADPDRSLTKIFAKHSLLPINMTRGVVVIDGKGIIRNRDVMLRAFRPRDEHILTSIYAARGDALTEEYSNLWSRLKGLIGK